MGPGVATPSEVTVDRAVVISESGPSPEKGFALFPDYLPFVEVKKNPSLETKIERLSLLQAFSSLAPSSTAFSFVLQSSNNDLGGDRAEIGGMTEGPYMEYNHLITQGKSTGNQLSSRDTKRC
ncbi:hypothetical protein Taro_015656 [Colocasia esculenta]|uniref:Uncharacterized protein n=1 Tax=Colocasia esculenta TaxID=4460 RepID=A0A843ULE0_COLES|nr:hypothetical protein [Colocasia esculenta]